MPRKFKTYDDFSGGFNDRFNQRKIKSNEFVTLNDLVVDDPLGEIRSIGASAQHGDVGDDTAVIEDGYGLFYFSHERNRSGTEAGGEEYIAMCDAANGKIDIWDKGTPGWQASQINIGSVSNAKAVFTYVDGVLRVADANLASGSRVRKYRYISVVHFADAPNAKDSGGIYSAWTDSNAYLRVPATLLIEGSPTYPTGHGIHLTVTSPNPPAGSWPAKTFQIAMSTVYEDDQESLLYIPTGNNTFTTSANDSLDIDVRSQSPWTQYYTGSRIYAREDGTDDEWFLLVDISVADGCRAKFDGDFTPWADAVTDEDVDCNSLVSIDQNLETYGMINGFSPDEPAISFHGTFGEGFKTAVIAGRRSFIGNVAMRNPNADYGLEKFPDRIFYSPINKFDTYPRSFKLDVVHGDSDSIVRLEEYNGMLAVFKDKTLYIVDITSNFPSKWRRAGTYNNRGVKHTNAVVKTPHGIVWANEFGCFLYNGKVIELSGNNILRNTWASFITDNTIVGYHPKRERIFVVGDCTASAPDAWTYGFKSGAWVKKIDMGTGADMTNFAIDWNGDMIVGHKQGSTDIRTYKWGDDAASTATGNAKFFDDDFGYPSIDKEITAITITYKSSEVQTNVVKYYTNGGVSATNLGSFSDTDAVDASWNILSVTPTPFKCQSLQLELDPNSSGTVNISDVTVEWRLLTSRRSS